jgi:predicted permease
VSWLNRVSNLFRRNRVDEDLDEELQFHLEARTRANLNGGMTAEEAQYDANRRFGNATLAKERAHEMEIVQPMETVWRDIRFAIRSLCKSPGFAIAVILTLACGFGANIAVFSVVNGVLLRPLPFPQPGRLFLLSYQSKQGPFGYRPGLYDRDYLEYQRHNRAFEQIATFNEDTATLTGAGDPVTVPIAMVTSSFFPVLEVNPAIGRMFLPDEGNEGNDHVALLSDAIWRSRFGANPNILGKTITLDGVQFNVVGVMPGGFEFPHQDALWLPLAVGKDPGNKYNRPVMGRLRPTVSRQQALAELEVFARALPSELGTNRKNMVAEILPLKDLLVANIRKLLLVLMGAVAFVLLIASANVANLLLIRGAARQREIALRNALGASRGRIVRQLLTESALLSLSGSAAGLLLAIFAVHALLIIAPFVGIPRQNAIHIDASVLGFALALGAFIGILFGLAPALQAIGKRAPNFLTLGGPTTTASRQRLHGLLAVSQVAIALILLTGAGLLLKSYVRMRAVDPGFSTQNIVTMTVDLPDATYQTVATMQAFDANVLSQLSKIPGVIAAGAVNWMPLQPALVQGNFHLEGESKLLPNYVVAKPAVSSDYFRVMGIRLRAGREFTEEDNASAPGVAIISQSVARTIWPGEDPLGKKITLRDNPEARDWLTIIGVVDDVRQKSLTEHPLPAIYQPYAQVTRSSFLTHMSFVVRTSPGLVDMAASVRGALYSVDKNQPASIEPLVDLADATTAETQFQTRLISIFSFLALLLAAIGIYSVLAYAVVERTREIAIRMAVGAMKSDVVFMLLRRTLLLVASGVAAGACGALALTRVLSKFLFEVRPTDPATFLSVAAVLAFIGILAGLLPARCATRVDPLVALRWE